METETTTQKITIAVMMIGFLAIMFYVLPKLPTWFQVALMAQ